MASTLRPDADSRHLLTSDLPQGQIAKDVRKADIELTPTRLRAFLTEIEKPAGPHGCWFWRGSVNRDGYASGRKGGMPHQLAYTWMVGEIPEGLELDHLCRNRACVNPHHLEPVTHAENLRRSREPIRPFDIRRYCRRGHVLDAHNARLWSNGKGQQQVRCYACHDAEVARG